VSTVEEIERAVRRLAPAELAAFREWFDEFEADAWDRRIEADAARGRLDALAAEALRDAEGGRGLRARVVIETVAREHTQRLVLEPRR
jgi:hypothetical protein